MSNDETAAGVILHDQTRVDSAQSRVEYIWVIENLKRKLDHDRNYSSGLPIKIDNYKWIVQLDTSVTLIGYCVVRLLNLTLKPAKGSIDIYGPVCGIWDVALLDAEGKQSHTRKFPFEFAYDESCVKTENYISRSSLYDANILTPEGQLKIHGTISYTVLDHPTHFDIEEVSDVDLYVGDRKYPAHKFILAAHSPVFEAMFTHAAMIENQQNRIDIRDTDANTFERMLRYMYTGQFDNLQSVAFELLLVADKYDVEKLKARCEVEITKMLSAETVVKALLLADMVNLPNLKKISIEYIVKHLAKVKKHKYLEDLTSRPNLFADILKAL